MEYVGFIPTLPQHRRPPTSGTSIVLAQGASVDDLVVVVVFDVFSVADTVSKADGGTFDGNVTMAGTLGVTGATTLTGALIGTAATLTNADNTAQLTLKSTDADANAGPLLDMKRDSSSPAADDFLGQINYIAENNAGEETTYAQITGRIEDVTDGAEDGRLTLKTMRAGSSRSAIDCRIDAIIVNDDGDDVDFRVETSNGGANTFFINSENNRIEIGTNSAAANRFWFTGINQDDAYVFFGHQSSNSNLGVLYINRNASDGELIQFRQGNIKEGDISVSGSTVSYNGFSGRHESSGIPTNTPVGTVVSTIDALDVYPNKTTDKDGNEITHPKAGQTRADHPKVEVSASVGDPCVYGIVSKFDGDGKLIVTSVGIGSIRVTGACSKGDLLESNGDGTAKVQSDDIIRSKTIGKVTIGNSDTNEKLVSCVMYCG